jgi:hypothetical protein
MSPYNSFPINNGKESKMFTGIKAYIAGGLVVLFLLLSGTAYFFYKENQTKMLEISQLKEVQIQLNRVIENRDIKIGLIEKNIQIKENELKANREALEAKKQEIDKIEESVNNAPGVNDDAAESLKKLFESLKGRK